MYVVGARWRARKAGFNVVDRSLDDVRPPLDDSSFATLKLGDIRVAIERF